MKLIDEAFFIENKSWGLWDSYDKENNKLVTSLTEQSCISATRFYLKGKQEGWGESQSYSGIVQGKL